MNPIHGPNLPMSPASAPSLLGVKPPATDGPSFSSFLLESLSQVNAMQNDADRAVEQLFTGGDVNPAEVLTAVQKADMSFRLMMQVRNKLVQVYQEIKDIRI